MTLSQKAQATRDRILKAATELFYLHGYHATGLDKVISLAGVTKGNFYYYFKSKEELAIATLDWQFEQVSAEIQDKVFAASTSVQSSRKKTPLKTLIALLELMANKQKDQYGNGYVRGCYFGNFTLELSTASVRIREKVNAIFDQYLTMIESLLRMARETGEISQNIDPVAMSPIILGQLEGAILLDKAKQKPGAVDESIRFIQQALQN